MPQFGQYWLILLLWFKQNKTKQTNKKNLAKLSKKGLVLVQGLSCRPGLGPSEEQGVSVTKSSECQHLL